MGLNKRLIDQAGGAAGVTNTDNFDVVTYSGNGGTQSISSLDFQPDLVWIKDRDNINHHTLFDSIRGENSILYPDLTNAIGTGEGFGSFDSNGFTLDTGYTRQNASGVDYVAWCFKGGGTAVSNTDGSITSSVSANQDAGFSIVKYTGTFTNSTVGHGLSSTPEMIIVKNTDAATNWWVWTKDIGGADKYLKLNGTDAVNTATSIWNNTLPTSTVFSVANDGGSNGSGNEIIAYCFHSVDGYQKIGSYSGTGIAGNSITTGFKPRFVMIKATNVSNDYTSWVIHDNLRNIESTDSVTDPLYANRSYQEGLRGNGSSGSGVLDLTFDSNGFTIENNDVERNASGYNYIYLAIA